MSSWMTSREPSAVAMARVVASLRGQRASLHGAAGAAAGTPGTIGSVGRVNDDLVRRHVGPGVVQDVPEPGRGFHADEDGDQHAEADRGEGRARAGPVAGQVAQGQPDRDRGAPAEPGQCRQAEGGQQDHRHDEGDEADDEPEHSAAATAAAAAAGVGQQDEGADSERDTGHGRAVHLPRRSGPPGQGGDDGDPGDRAGRPRGGEEGGHDGQRPSPGRSPPTAARTCRSRDGRSPPGAAGRRARRPGLPRPRSACRRHPRRDRWPARPGGCAGPWRPARRASRASAAGAAPAP